MRSATKTNTKATEAPKAPRRKVRYSHDDLVNLGAPAPRAEAQMLEIESASVALSAAEKQRFLEGRGRVPPFRRCVLVPEGGGGGQRFVGRSTTTPMSV